jgi:hypothetical protein
MDFHLNRKVVLSQESEYASLYKWSLRERDDAGKQHGLDQVPWNWSVVFTATELTLNEELRLKIDTPLLAQLKAEEHADDEEHVITTEEREYIRAELRPGYFADPDGGARYSMFGTDRAIKSFRLWIYKREDEAKPERCHAWGSLSYTTEIDFRNETADDTVQFYLHVSALRFSQYVEMARKYPANIIVLRLGQVRGLYSEWSPSISTNSIKVLTNAQDHKLTIPEGCPITPPTLGSVGEFSLTLVTRRSCEKPPREIELDGEELPEGVVEKAQSPDEEGLLLQRAAIKLAVQHGQTMKYLSYAAWIIAALLAVIVLRH